MDLFIKIFEIIGTVAFALSGAITGMKKNMDVKSAHDEWYNSESDSFAGKRGYEAAEATFKYKFKIVCMNVEEQERLVRAANEEVSFQKRTFEIAAKKYELGMISYEEYMTAQNDLKTAQSSLYSSQLELLTAYRNFVWARDSGIV